MAEIIFIIIFAVPAILGISEIIHSLRLWLVSSKSSGEKVLVLVPDDEGFSKQILGAFEESKWCGNRLANKIVVVDDLLSEENKKECREITSKLGLEICNISELSNIVI